jgi:thiamine-phosphate pyrophosphorylase
MVSGN